jgi:hypothetical protein
MDTAGYTPVSVFFSGAALAANGAGVALSQPFSPEIYAQVRNAKNEHLVLRLHGQTLDDPPAA